MKFISPNELHKAACDHMLAGKEPHTRHDWILVANFWAANAAPGFEKALPILGILYNCPLKEVELLEIAQFQAGRK